MSESHNPTRLLYWLPGSTLCHETSILLGTRSGAADGETLLILDETIFHPFGGGQLGDQGTISQGEKSLEVIDATMDKAQGVVLHKVMTEAFEASGIKIGDKIKLSVKKDVRNVNRQLHSAGHLIDVAMEQGLGIRWSPTKGNHTVEKSFVEYQYDAGIKEWNPDLKAMIEKELGQYCQDLIGQDIPTKITIDGIEASETPSDAIKAPVASDMRIVTIADKACPCGGTHVQSTSEIGPIVIKEVTKKKKAIRVIYDVKVAQPA